MSRASTPRPERVDQQLLGHRRDEQVRACRGSRCAASRRRRPCVPSASWPEASIGPPASCVRHAPTASKFSSAKPIGSITLWQLAHTGIGAVLRPSARASSSASRPSASPLSDGTSAGGGGTGSPSRFSSTHLPRSTGDVRSACDVTARMLPWPSSAAARVVGHRHAAELAAVDVGDAVVPRQPLVHERVVGAQQVEHAAVLADDALEQQLGLAAERLPQVVVEVRETRRSWAARCARCAAAATGRRSWRPARSARGSASIRRTCALEHRRLREPCRAAAARSSVLVRDAAPQEERQPRGQLEVADAMDAARHRAGRIALDAEDEPRAGEDALQPALDAGSKLPRARAVVVELEDRRAVRRRPTGRR